MVTKQWLLLLHVLACLAEDVRQNVVEYSSDNFTKILENDNHFVMFYAPWCGHCKRLMPVWEQLASAFTKDPRVTVAKVDCTKEDDLCSRHDITGYPTLKLFKPGTEEAVKYKGQRDLETLSSFLSQQIGGPQLQPAPAPGPAELTEEDFDAATATGAHFVKFYAPWCGHCQKLAPTWDELASKLRGGAVQVGRVDCTVHRSVCDRHHIKGYPTLLFIRDGHVEKYTGHRSLEDLAKFVETMSSPAEPALSPAGPLLSADSFRQGVAQGTTFVQFFAPWCGHCKRLAPVWAELGGRLPADAAVRLARVDCTQPGSRDLCSEQEVEGFPTLLVYKNGERIAEYNGSRDINDLYSFIESYYRRPSDEL